MSAQAKAVFRRTALFMGVILVLCVLSLPLTVSFAFDAPGTTPMQVAQALAVFYIGYVLLPWFVLALLFNAWRVRIR